ncbi:peptidoglycan-binding protein [Amphibacillus indicireducens]
MKKTWIGLLLLTLFCLSPLTSQAELVLEDSESNTFIDGEAVDQSQVSSLVELGEHADEEIVNKESNSDKTDIAESETKQNKEKPQARDESETVGDEQIEGVYIEDMSEPEINQNDMEPDEDASETKEVVEVEEEAIQPRAFSLNNTPSVFQKGDRHPTISDLKVKLNRVGFSGITVTDLFGDYMERKVKEFQAYYGLSQNGRLDRPTIQKLEEVYNSPFQLGQRHNDIKDIKRKLNQLGFSGITVTTFYGEYMEDRVKDFQRAYGLKANGIVDEVTLNRLNAEASKTDFRVGDRHPNISEIKVKLNRIGFSGILVTDYYGDYTADRVRDFQRYYGLSVTGRTDRATIQKLDEVYYSPFQMNQRHDDTPEIKRMLNQLGFGGITVTTLYGAYMERKVLEFQESQGLVENGIVDAVTLDRLEELTSVTVFQKGNRHPAISEFKVKLNRVGFSGILVTDYFGDYTEDRVKDFQAYYGIPVTGKMDAQTSLKLDEVYNSPFQLNNRHVEINEIKHNLNLFGYGRILVTSLYGSYMEEQVKLFQRDHGLIVNGIVDEVTYKKINDIANEKVVKIFLDPGHGGRDPGGQGYGLDEKDVVLDIALKLADILQNQYLYVDINLSRETDRFIELEDRSKMANAWGADFFLSIHTNAHNGTTSGFETFIHSGNVSQETRARQITIHNYIMKNLSAIDRGQKTANFSVLRNTSMPALLVEYLFIDNYAENQLLRTSSYRSHLAQITAEAIAQSFGLERR